MAAVAMILLMTYSLLASCWRGALFSICPVSELDHFLIGICSSPRAYLFCLTPYYRNIRGLAMPYESTMSMKTLS